MGQLLQDLFTEVPLSEFLKERLALADENYERAIHEIESCKERVAAIERENESLRSQILAGPASGLSGDTARVLVHLFEADTKEEGDVEAMARKLAMGRNIVLYHLDQLQKAGLADMASGKYIHGSPVHWSLTAEGRKRVVEGKLI